MDLSFYEVIHERRSVREFQPRPIEAEKLLRVLGAGLKAPSHNHLREWEFIFVRDVEQRMKVVECGAKAENVTSKTELEETTKDMTDELQKKMYLQALPVQKKMLMNSPELLVICFRMRKPLKECKSIYELNSLASVWTCIENILLAMTAEGLYGVTYVPQATSSLKKILDLPRDYDIAAIIPIGYPAHYSVVQKPVEVEEKIHYDRW